MKHFILVFGLLLAQNLFSQSQNYSCCVLPPDTSIAGTPAHHCFNVDSIIDNCITVFLNVNIHFFLPDDCDGDIGTAPTQTGDLSKENAFALAEQLINDANSFLEEIGNNVLWGVDFHGGTPDTTECIPIQLVLNGVQVHCDSDAQNTNVNFSDFTGYRHNSGSELNIFVSNVLPRAFDNPNGFAGLGGKEMVVENFNPSLLIHELGHLLGLDHPFSDQQGCDDIWGENFSWNYDTDCDGQPDESGLTCWQTEQGREVVEPDTTYYLSYCDTSHPDVCEIHPCCYWHNQNNNVMSYNKHSTNPAAGAFSPCQLRKMMEHLSLYKCDYIESVGTCPPPKSNIGLLPPNYAFGNCPTCFNLEASFNEDLHDIDILDSQGNIIVQTGHIYNEATTFCIEPKADKFGNPYWPNGMVAGDTLTLRLTVQNDCGDSDVEEVQFVLPLPCSTLDPEISVLDNFVVDSLSPNPGSQIVQLYVDSEVSTSIIVYGIHSTTGTTYGEPMSQQLNAADNQIINLDVTSWLQGIHTIVVTDGQEIELQNFLKL